jgi:hypothetical protein
MRASLPLREPCLLGGDVRRTALGTDNPAQSAHPAAAGVLTRIGLALAGRAGARLAAAVGLTVGKDTLLRPVRSLPEPEIGQVEILGVDDFAFCRGRRYDTSMPSTTTWNPAARA